MRRNIKTYRTRKRKHGDVGVAYPQEVSTPFPPGGIPEKALAQRPVYVTSIRTQTVVNMLTGKRSMSSGMSMSSSLRQPCKETRTNDVT